MGKSSDEKLRKDMARRIIAEQGIVLVKMPGTNKYCIVFSHKSEKSKEIPLDVEQGIGALKNTVAGDLADKSPSALGRVASCKFKDMLVSIATTSLAEEIWGLLLTEHGLAPAFSMTVRGMLDGLEDKRYTFKEMRDEIRTIRIRLLGKLPSEMDSRDLLTTCQRLKFIYEDEQGFFRIRK